MPRQTVVRPHESAGTKRTHRDGPLFVRFRGKRTCRDARERFGLTQNPNRT
jgi:hypothetical protein